MVLLLLVVGLVLGGPTKREKRGKKTGAHVALRVPEGTGVDPRFLPALIGQTEKLELEGLNRTSIRFTVDQDGTVLQQIDADTVAALRRQLAADPRWRLTRLRDTWVATRRVDEGGSWTGGPEGYHLANDHCWRLGVRLGAPGPGYPWGDGVAINRQPASERISLNWAVVLDEPPCRDQRAVALVVEAENLAVEMLDSGDGNDLPVVVEGLEDVPIELANAGIDSALIAQRGFDPSQLPGPLPSPAHPTLATVSDGLELRAAVHVDQPGLSWARILRDGKPWEEAAVAEATLEAPGWSAEPTDAFPLQSRIPLPVDAPFEGQLELWFQPDGGEPTALWTGPVTIGG